MAKTKAMTILGMAMTVACTTVMGLLAGACSSSGRPEINNADLNVNDKAPDFRLEDHTGGYIQLSDYKGKKNVVLAFYPLAWTPV